MFRIRSYYTKITFFNPLKCGSQLTTLHSILFCLARIKASIIPKSFFVFLISLRNEAASSQSCVNIHWISEIFLTILYNSSKSWFSLIHHPFISARQHSGVTMVLSSSSIIFLTSFPLSEPMKYSTHA